MAVPKSLDGARVLFTTPIDDRHHHTGKTRHHKHGELQLAAQGLAICHYEAEIDGGFYLFGCDADWKVVTDTWHETVDAAKRQAAFEYDGVDSTWRSH